MKKHIKSFTALLMCVVLLASLFGCGSSGTGKSGEAVRTVLLYGIGSNLETDYGMLTWNLVQILKADIPENVNVIVMTGGSEEWQTEPEYLEGAEAIGEDAENQFWICSGKNASNAENEHGKMTLLEAPEELGSVSMSVPETLQAFIDYSAEKYPAQMYDLILWDHGGGPQGGFGMDELHWEDGTLDLAQMISAIKGSKVEHFDIIDFDACLMSSVEVTAAFAEFADYLIVSPETEPGYGQEYTTWLNAVSEKPDMSGYELGKIIVDACVDFYEDETTEGYGQDATLSVIDLKNFRERMVPELTKLAETMNSEFTVVGNNQLLNFTDEFRLLPMMYRYYDESLIDLGTLADHLGICMSELDNYETAYDLDTEKMENAYTETTQEIENILYDQDGSDDDVIYQRFTEGTVRPVSAEVRYTRNADGILENEKSLSPTGLSIFLNPLDVEYSLKYLQVMDDVRELIDDENIKNMLKEYEVASARYLLTEASGLTVSKLHDAGEKNIYYKTIKEYWQTDRPMSRMEIETYKEQMGLEANITSMEATDWDAYIGTLVDLLDKNSDDDTETWLALLSAQQASETIHADRTEAVGIDRNGNGELDAYHVKVSSPLSLVKDVSMNFRATGVSISDDWKEEFGDAANLGKVRGEMAMEEFLDYLYGYYGTLEGSAMAIYKNEYSEFELGASVEKWYELKDSEGVGHVICVGEVDLDNDTELRIPVEIYLKDMEEGEALQGTLVFSNGRFVGFSETFSPTPIIPLSKEMFDGARIATCQQQVIDFWGISFPLNDPISPAFELSADRTNDRGMSLVVTPVSEIVDLADGELRNDAVITDIYGYEHDISAAMKEANEKFAAGEMLRSIEGAEITYAKLNYTGESLKPKFTVTFDGKELKKDEDYSVLVEPQTEPGNYRAIIFGRGNYCDYVVTDFTIDNGE